MMKTYNTPGLEAVGAVGIGGGGEIGSLLN